MTRKSAFKMTIVIALAALFGALAAAATMDLKLKPGKYALTVTYEVQDQRQNQSRSATRCIRAADLDNPEKIFDDQVAATPKEKDACSVKDLKNADGKISYDAQCANRTVHVEGTLTGGGFSVVRTVIPKGNQGISLKFTVSGKRTGDCLSLAER
ncbi:MAG TPA: DUF3617 family protein [Candidatus Acidoferrales bacterium]|nr:DUF3617 family protein [Candidatus Acidoferrales bacterium]